MTDINPTYANMMRTAAVTPVKVKTKKQEVKEIIENPNDPLAKYPLRAFGYSNEVGAAVSAMPVWGKTAEAALWVPALMYLGADIFDKYKKGKEGNYSQASVTAAVEQATFQGLASVLLPTAAVKMGQGIAGNLPKFGKTKLSATAQEEMYRKILSDFDKGKFAKNDFVNGKGELVKGLDKVLDKILNKDFDDQLATTRHDLKTESKWAKVKRFFGHSQRPIVSAKSDETVVKDFLKNKAKDVYEIQTALESGDQTAIDALKNTNVSKRFHKIIANVEKRAADLLKEYPGHVVKKILNSNDPKLGQIKEQIITKYPTHLELKALVSSQKLSKGILDELSKTAEHQALIGDFTKRIETTRSVMRKYLKGKETNLGLLKTAGGFAALALLAVPIDHFVHKYIIKMFVEPGLENVEKLQSKLAFKGTDKGKTAQ